MKDNAKPMKGIRIQILALLARKPDLTVADMIDSLPDFTEKQIGDNCYQAKQDGLLTSRTDGLTRKQAYSITDQGKSRIKSDAAPIKDFLTTEPAKPVVKGNLTTEQVKRNPFQPQGADMVELRKLVEDGAKENMRLHKENQSLRVDINNLIVNELELSEAGAVVITACERLTEEATIKESELATVIAECNRLRDVVAEKEGEISRIAFEQTTCAAQQVTVEQFMVRIPKRKPFVVKSLEKARQQAMRAAKFVGKAEVFAMVPIGDAVRGAVWNQKQA